MSNSKKVNVEKDWITASGLRAVVIMTMMGHRCGYVGVDKSHALYGVSYDKLYELGVYIEVHGGITYSDFSSSYPVESDLYWFGFDCAHVGDKTSGFSFPGDVLRSLDYCIGECEAMAYQLCKEFVLKTDEYILGKIKLTVNSGQPDSIIVKTIQDLLEDMK